MIEELDKFLRGLNCSNFGQQDLLNAMRYSLISENAKYIRSFLIFETTKLFDEFETSKDKILKLAICIEMIHAYSLIHDDLPAMDNSDYRRGKYTCHKQFSESTALLAGNALLALAFWVIADLPPLVIKEISNASGLYGIMSGQIMDLKLAKDTAPNLVEFELMNYYKTGKLIELSVTITSIMLEQKWATDALRSYGRSIGRVFQMIDDLIDHTEDGNKFSYINYYNGRANLLLASFEEGLKTKECLFQFKNNSTLVNFVNFLLDRKS